MARNYYLTGRPDINLSASRREHAIAIRAVRPAGIPRPTTARADRPHWTLRLAALPARLWAKLLLGQEQRRATRILATFDDRMLKDIGISRCDIEYLHQGGQTKHLVSPWE